MTSDNLGEIATALAAMQAEMPVVPKAQRATVEMKNGGSFSYTYASMHDVTRIVYPLLAKHGLAFTCAPQVRPDGTATIDGILIHSSGESITSSLPVFGRTAQEIGSSLTYARRYLLGCLTGVVTDDDEDGSLANNAAQLETPVTERTRRRMFKLFKLKGVPEDQQLPGINHITQSAYESRGDITEADAKRVIEVLERRPDAPLPAAADDDSHTNQADSDYAGVDEPRNAEGF